MKKYGTQSLPAAFSSVIAILAAVLCLRCATAVTYYVSHDGNNTFPYTNWAMASTDVVANTLWNAFADGDTLMISTGTYKWTQAQRMKRNNMTIAGVANASDTVLDGGGGAYSAYFTMTALTSFIHNVTFSNFGDRTINPALSRLHMSDCIVVGNSASAGAGIYVPANGVLYATNCIIRANTASAGFAGAGVYHDGAKCVLDNCTISDNRGTAGNSYGAGIFATETGLVVRNSRILNNSANFRGAGIYLNNPGCLIENCFIASNTLAGDRGAGISVAPECTVRNCLIAYNCTTANAAGVYMAGGVMENCTVVSNFANNYGGVGGHAGSVMNSIVYHNTATTFSPNGTTSGEAWTNCCVTNAVGVNCVTNDPMFKDMAAGDFTLSPDSPCIDMGMDMPGLVTDDLNGAARPKDGGTGQGKKWDIGCFEYAPGGTMFFVY